MMNSNWTKEKPKYVCNYYTWLISRYYDSPLLVIVWLDRVRLVKGWNLRRV